MHKAFQFYNKQKKHFNNDIKKEDRKPFHKSWFNEDTVDFWRHKRMYETIRSIAEYFNDKKWISIGDGRYGLDSVRLKKLFNIKVLPTDISEKMLQKGKEMGVIEDYRIENAENLSFDNNSFDVVFCKESFHHFPRPIIALYEMIRVSRIAVILIEPYDYILLSNPKILFKQMIKNIINNVLPQNRFIKKEYNIWKTRNWHSFEESGNYVYSVSIKELEKIIHGLNLGGLAYRGFNDHYIKGCEFEEAEPDNEMFLKIRKIITNKDSKAKKYPFFYGYNLVTAVIFKKNIDNKLISSMIKKGFKFSKKIMNPYC